MNRYLVILWGGDAKLAELKPDEREAHLKRWAQWMAGLAAQGKLEGGEPLGQEGRVVKGPGKVVSDGPYPEAKEAVGGYLIFKAGDIDEAAELTKGCPLFDVDGTVEVRPIRPLNQM